MAQRHFSTANFTQHNAQVTRLVRLQREAETLAERNQTDISALVVKMTENEQHCERRRGEKLLGGRKTLNPSSFPQGILTYLKSRRNPANLDQILNYLQTHHYVCNARTGWMGTINKALGSLVLRGEARRNERGLYSAV